nr:PAS domain-containing sensor histidine kinase [Methylomarinum sp. Ch1-1]MDP4521874.1 PAS domain-containing sensor histidine kinase [Methylomarinum sp. Ch1-1]
MLNESKKRLSTIIANVHAIIWTMDDNRQVTFISDYITQLLGFPASQLSDSRDCLAIIHRRDHYRLIHTVLRTLSQQIPGHIKCRIRHRNHCWRWICISMTPVKLNDDSWQIVGFVHDAHQDYLQQKQIRLMNKQLDKRVRQAIAENLQQEKIIASQARFAAMGEMVANIAHQWRQPLNSLSLTLEDLQEAEHQNQSNKQFLQQSIDKALQQIDKMSATIDVFQSRLQGENRKQFFAVPDVIHDTANLVQDYLSSQGINLVIEARQQTYAYGSPEELSQVFQNLIANARDAILTNNSSNKEIRFALTADSKQSIIEISDSGGGIDSAIKDRIFDPFFSSKNSARGIGLYMAKQLIEQSLHGSISLDNDQHGVKVTITLPNKRNRDD